ncbi:MULTISPECIES: DNA alkylation repair protein [Mycolicibacterium]|uniref:DNA alkylation repair protein n=1 Tax=Mycolicibacterium monacense TaxID=85693 RepID=UPI0007EA665B|nr:DNA alkylation repair protein [Mycolicibacterium monacense]OBB58946.1 DNA alkylation repair protein [Mycolicibacterium monacense]
MVALIDSVRRELAAAADPDRAPAMQAYMKSPMPYYGIRLPDVRRLCGPVFDAHPLGSETSFEDAVERMFVEATHREERYAAIQLARHRRYRPFQTPDRIPLYRRLIIAGDWWDTVDEIAGNLIGPILVSHPAEVRPIVLGWATDHNLWLRRTAIISQLSAKERTDLELLTCAIDANAGDTEFFIRKAIGWALRQYARTDPTWVLRFVAAREDRLSGLSKREARKHLLPAAE